MKKLFATAAIIALAGPALANGHLGNNGQDSGKKKGWVADPDKTDLGAVPRGLWISGDNGRTDKGGGNGGENLNGNTPNKNGENTSDDDDDDPGN